MSTGYGSGRRSQANARACPTLGLADRVRVLPDLRRKVRFRVHDLLSDWDPGSPSYHMVLCRNMLIYLSGPQQQGIYAKFAQALLPGGFLVLGLTETLLGAARRYFQCVDVRYRIYRRT